MIFMVAAIFLTGFLFGQSQTLIAAPSPSSIFYKELQDFKPAPKTYVDIPEDFKHFESLKYFYGKPECAEAAVKQVYAGGLVFIYTNMGDCDGDNSYGLAYQDGKIIGIIRDSFIYPITLEEVFSR